MSNLTSASKVALYVDGALYSKVFSFSWNANTPVHALHTIDCTQPLSLDPTTSDCSGAIGVWKTSGDGGAEGSGFTAPYQNVVSNKYFTLALVEYNKGLILFEANNCLLVSQSWDVQVLSFITGRLTFQSIEWNNEVRPTTLIDYR